MQKPHEHAEQIDALTAAGYELVVVRPGSKAPAFKGWQDIEYTRDELHRLLVGSNFNIGVRTGGPLIVLDIDTQDAADIEWVRENVGDTPMKVRTPSGGEHWYFGTREGVEYGNGVRLQCRSVLRKEPLDLRWKGTQAVRPWSVNSEGVPYVQIGPIVPVLELPKIKVSPLRARKKKARQSTIVPEVVESGSIVHRGRGYVDKIDRRAVSGAGGHTSLFIAALKISGFVKKLSGTQEEAWLLLLYYNATKCDPSWDVSDDREVAALRHKLDDAWNKAR